MDRKHGTKSKRDEDHPPPPLKRVPRMVYAPGSPSILSERELAALSPVSWEFVSPASPLPPSSPKEEEIPALDVTGAANGCIIENSDGVVLYVKKHSYPCKANDLNLLKYFPIFKSQRELRNWQDRHKSGDHKPMIFQILSLGTSPFQFRDEVTGLQLEQAGLWDPKKWKLVAPPDLIPDQRALNLVSGKFQDNCALTCQVYPNVRVCIDTTMVLVGSKAPVEFPLSMYQRAFELLVLENPQTMMGKSTSDFIVSMIESSSSAVWDMRSKISRRCLEVFLASMALAIAKHSYYSDMLVHIQTLLAAALLARSNPFWSPKPATAAIWAQWMIQAATSPNAVSTRGVWKATSDPRWSEDNKDVRTNISFLAKTLDLILGDFMFDASPRLVPKKRAGYVHLDWTMMLQDVPWMAHLDSTMTSTNQYQAWLSRPWPELPLPAKKRALEVIRETSCNAPLPDQVLSFAVNLPESKVAVWLGVQAVDSQLSWCLNPRNIWDIVVFPTNATKDQQQLVRNIARQRLLGGVVFRDNELLFVPSEDAKQNAFQVRTFDKDGSRVRSLDEFLRVTAQIPSEWTWERRKTLADQIKRIMEESSSASIARLRQLIRENWEGEDVVIFPAVRPDGHVLSEDVSELGEGGAFRLWQEIMFLCEPYHILCRRSPLVYAANPHLFWAWVLVRDIILGHHVKKPNSEVPEQKFNTVVPRVTGARLYREAARDMLMTTGHGLVRLVTKPLDTLTLALVWLRVYLHRTQTDRVIFIEPSGRDEGMTDKIKPWVTCVLLDSEDLLRWSDGQVGVTRKRIYVSTSNLIRSSGTDLSRTLIVLFKPDRFLIRESMHFLMITDRPEDVWIMSPHVLQTEARFRDRNLLLAATLTPHEADQTLRQPLQVGADAFPLLPISDPAPASVEQKEKGWVDVVRNMTSLDVNKKQLLLGTLITDRDGNLAQCNNQDGLQLGVWRTPSLLKDNQISLSSLISDHLEVQVSDWCVLAYVRQGKKIFVLGAIFFNERRSGSSEKVLTEVILLKISTNKEEVVPRMFAFSCFLFGQVLRPNPPKGMIVTDASEKYASFYDQMGFRRTGTGTQRRAVEMKHLWEKSKLYFPSRVTLRHDKYNQRLSQWKAFQTRGIPTAPASKWKIGEWISGGQYGHVWMCSRDNDPKQYVLKRTNFASHRTDPLVGLFAMTLAGAEGLCPEIVEFWNDPKGFVANDGKKFHDHIVMDFVPGISIHQLKNKNPELLDRVSWPVWLSIREKFAALGALGVQNLDLHDKNVFAFEDSVLFIDMEDSRFVKFDMQFTLPQMCRVPMPKHIPRLGLVMGILPK